MYVSINVKPHLQLNVQLSHRTGQGAEVGQDVFTEVRYETCGMHIFLPDRRKILII